MRSVTLIALLAFAAAETHAQQAAANDMNDSQHHLDKLLDGLVDELFADKLVEEGDEGEEDQVSDETEETQEGDENEEEAMEGEDDEGDETEEDEAMESEDEGDDETEEAEVEDGDETVEAEEDQEGEASDLVDVLADKFVDRMLRVTFLPNADLVLGLRGGAKKKKAPKKKATKAPKKKKTTKKGAGKKKKKAKKVSKIAKGKYAKALVFRGSKVKTASGLAKSDLMKNKAGKVVSKKQSAKGKALYAKYAKKWIDAVMKARKALGLKGFAAIKKGTPLYSKAKSFYR